MLKKLINKKWLIKTTKNADDANDIIFLSVFEC
jgi:hypothetical protein